MAGIVFLTLAKAKHTLRGYVTPRTFANDDYAKAIIYDKAVVNAWLQLLADAGHEKGLTGANVLELGPGPDLGTGICLLANGAESYTAVDINSLAIQWPHRFYDLLVDELVGTYGPRRESLLSKLDRGGLRYLHAPDFHFEHLLSPNSVDVVFSQAAFEHFSDVHGTFSQLSPLMRDPGLLVAEIDLKTHSRWIRDVDPNNIYRFSTAVYRMFSFPGAPNRMRPNEYVDSLRTLGWEPTVVRAIERSPEAAAGRFAKQFQSPEALMEWLTFNLAAEYKAPASNE